MNKIETNKMLINEAALKQSDRELLTILQDYVNDMLENKIYNALINEIFVQI